MKPNAEFKPGTCRVNHKLFHFSSVMIPNHKDKEGAQFTTKHGRENKQFYVTGVRLSYVGHGGDTIALEGSLGLAPWEFAFTASFLNDKQHVKKGKIVDCQD